MLLLDAIQPLVDETTSSGFELFNKLSPKFFIRLGMDLLSIFTLVRLVYYPVYRKRDLFFTFFIFNIIIFLITFLLNKVEMSMGAAFGLFAVFSMLRYRTEDISLKDMTYLFLCIAIGLITAITKGGWDELLLINLIIILVTYLLEGKLLMKKEVSKLVMYDNLDLVKPEAAEALLQDLRQRTGLNIHRISVDKFDFLRDSVFIRIYYYE